MHFATYDGQYVWAWLCKRKDDWMIKSGKGDPEESLTGLAIEKKGFDQITPVGQQIWMHLGQTRSTSLTFGMGT